MPWRYCRPNIVSQHGAHARSLGRIEARRRIARRPETRRDCAQKSVTSPLAARPRYGYRRIHTLLRREGFSDNIKRVYRLYRLDALHVRSKPRKKRRAVVRIPPTPATAPNERWGA